MFQRTGGVRNCARRTVRLVTPGPVRSYQWILLVIGLLLLQSFTACSLYTVRPINAASNGGQSDQFNQQFDPKAYATSVWASKVVPTVLKKAIDINTILSALRTNSDNAQKQYAIQSSDGFYNFMVKGQGKVSAVNTSSRSGTLSIQLPANQGETVLQIQIGPVLLGTALRDSVGFINYNQFTNQVQYAQVADALNTHAIQDLQSTDVTRLAGKTITFYGAFTFTDVKQITIAPVKITTS
jgi:predicted lipoprotein